MPLVSVIVPSFNHAEFLEARINSILNQSFIDFELILLDDCSPDLSFEIIKRFENHPKVAKVIKNEINTGHPYWQWKKGFDLVDPETKYIWIAESDDLAHKDFLKSQVEILENESEVGLVFCASNWIDNNDNIIEQPKHEAIYLRENGNELIKKEFVKGCFIYNGSAAVFRKSLLEKVDSNKISKFLYTSDWLFWVQIISDIVVVRIPNRYNLFRRHDKNTSFKSDKKGLQFLEGFQVVNYIIKKYKLNLTNRIKIYIFWAQKVYLNTDISHEKALMLLPKSIRFWYFFVPIIRKIKAAF